MNSKLEKWNSYCQDWMGAEPEDYCTEWSRNFKENNPLAVALMYYMDNNDRHIEIDMIEQLEDTLLNYMPKEYNIDENYRDTFQGVESILENPDNFPKKLADDLDSVLNQYYKLSPIFKWNW